MNTPTESAAQESELLAKQIMEYLNDLPVSFEYASDNESTVTSGIAKILAGIPSTDKLCNSHWISGAQFGWNCGIDEAHGGRRRLNEAIEKRMKDRAPQPPITKDAPTEERFFLDHGLWHDRVTGQHLYTEDQFREQGKNSYRLGYEVANRGEDL